MATAIEASHEVQRGKVCVICYQKKADRLVSNGDTEVIQKYVIEGYTSSNTDFPNGICIRCSVSLSKKWKDSNFVIPNLADNYDPGRKTSLRSATICDCRICNMNRGREIGLKLHHNRKNKRKRGRPPANPTPQSFKVCGNCFTKLYRGCSHSSELCNSRRNKVDSVLSIASPTSLTRAASRIANDEMPSTPLGRPKKIVEAKKELLFTTDDIYGMAQDLQLTGAGTKTLTRDIRSVAGSRKAIEKNAMQGIREKNHQVDEYFAVDTYAYKNKVKETKLEVVVERHTVLCTNLEGFLETVLEKRHREWGDNMLLRIGLDGGGGFFKIVLSVFDKDDPFPHVRSNLSKNFKESGVKKLFVIALVPDICENYVNVKKLWIHLGVQQQLNRKYTIATDLKLCNILLGMMSHSSCHPCCWCDSDKDHLNKKGTARTISSLMKLFWKFYDSNCGIGEAKKFGNVIHPPMVNDDEDDNTLVIQLIPPPELHLMTGPVNTMFKGLEAVWPESDKWLKSCNVKKTEFHGGQFIGNDCKKLITSTEKIENPSGMVMNYIEAFERFNDVVHACYGNELMDDYIEKIKKFSIAYNKLRISITPKVHAVVYHIEEFCSLTGRGLAPWSEQTVEATHHDFNKTSWEKFKIKDMENPNYGDHLLRAVREYNGKHV